MALCTDLIGNFFWPKRLTEAGALKPSSTQPHDSDCTFLSFCKVESTKIWLGTKQKYHIWVKFWRYHIKHNNGLSLPIAVIQLLCVSWCTGSAWWPGQNLYSLMVLLKNGALFTNQLVTKQHNLLLYSRLLTSLQVVNTLISDSTRHPTTDFEIANQVGHHNRQ